MTDTPEDPPHAEAATPLIVRPTWPRYAGIGVVLAIIALAIAPVLTRSHEVFPPPPVDATTRTISAEPGERVFVGWSLPVAVGDTDVRLDAATLGALDDSIELLGVWALRYDETSIGSLDVAGPGLVAEHYNLHLLDEVVLQPGVREWYLAFELALTQPGEATAGPIALRWRAGEERGEYRERQTYTLAGGYDALAGGRTCGRPDLTLALAVAGPTVKVDLVPAGAPCAIDATVDVAVLSGPGFASMEGNPADGYELRGIVDDALDLVTTIELPCDAGALEFVVIVKTADGLILAEEVQPFDAPPCADGEVPAGSLGPLVRPSA